MTANYQTDDIRIQDIKQLLPPVAVIEKYPTSAKASETVFMARSSIHKILHDQDDKLLVVVGPCSINNSQSAIEYAQKLLKMREKYGDQLEILMRVYFEKPRTTVGWKGLINDPYLDHSFKINDGIRMARKLLLDLNNLGVPAAVEFLDMISPQYIADLISWGAIGARTTESQVHRELASGLSCPVGFKNATNGSVKLAIDAARAASAEHNFLSVTKFGHSAIVSTTGNCDCHIILRGGNGEPNYSAQHVAAACEQLETAAIKPKVMVDFSHANSRKQFKRQMDVGANVIEQIDSGSNSIFGVMIESNLVEGSQELIDGRELVYGQSITDGCLGWDDTEELLEQLATAVDKKRNALR